MKKIFLFLIISGLFIACEPNTNQATQDVQEASVLPTSAQPASPATADQDVWLESLITATPQEGRELAITMARKTIGAIQSDPAVKKRLRADYAEDSEQLILSAQVVATEFQTVAAANNYWRK